MDTPNIQDANVGNLGDIVKHAALVTLAELLRERNAGLIRHVETHTFRLTAPLPDPAAWRAALAAHPSAAGFAAYAAREAGFVAQGRYRCSAGLAADTLGPPLRLLLAEAHAPTRAALADALAFESLPVESLVDQAAALAALPPGPPAALLVHVDPFDHPRVHWPVVERLLGAWRREEDAVVLAYAYDKHAAIAWPPAPSGLVSLGTYAARPHGLAAWASPAFAPAARAALAALGWSPPVEPAPGASTAAGPE